MVGAKTTLASVASAVVSWAVTREPPTVSDEDLRERAALVALYNATNGNNWTDSTNWGTDEALDHWHGVTASGGDRVERLNLHTNNLPGPLPSSMTNLGRLEILDIGNNAGLCAPADAAFQAWLATVGDFRGETCADEPTPTMLTLSAASAPAEGGNPVTVTATLDNPAPANGMTGTLTTSGTATLGTVACGVRLGSSRCD